MLLFQRVITILCVYILKKSIIIKKNFSVAFTCFRIQNSGYIMIFNYSLIFKTCILKCTYVSQKKKKKELYDKIYIQVKRSLHMTENESTQN